MAKSSRSSSVGEGIQTPPCSPCFHKSRKSCGELEAEPPLLTSSPISSASSLSSCPQSNAQSPTSSQPTAAVFPSRPIQNVLPSRIPLPKQPLSPRRSLCLEVTPSSRVSTPTAGPGCDVTPAPGKQGWCQTRCRDVKNKLSQVRSLEFKKFRCVIFNLYVLFSTRQTSVS